MNYTIYTTPKQAILKKLKEIGMEQQEDRKSVDSEMDKVLKDSGNYGSKDTEYFKTIYSNEELKQLHNGQKLGDDKSIDQLYKEDTTKSDPVEEEVNRQKVKKESPLITESVLIRKK